MLGTRTKWPLVAADAAAAADVDAAGLLEVGVMEAAVLVLAVAPVGAVARDITSAMGSILIVVGFGFGLSSITVAVVAVVAPPFATSKVRAAWLWAADDVGAERGEIAVPLAGEDAAAADNCCCSKTWLGIDRFTFVWLCPPDAAVCCGGCSCC